MQNENPNTSPLVPVKPATSGDGKQAVSSNVVEVSANQPEPLGNPAVFSKSKDDFFDWVFRIGFASVFFINSYTAVAHPDSFMELIKHNFLANQIGHYELLIHAIAVNDLLIGLVVLSGKKRKYVYAWAGVWLATVTFFKATSL